MKISILSRAHNPHNARRWRSTSIQNWSCRRNETIWSAAYSASSPSARSKSWRDGNWRTGTYPILDMYGENWGSEVGWGEKAEIWRKKIPTDGEARKATHPGLKRTCHRPLPNPSHTLPNTVIGSVGLHTHILQVVGFRTTVGRISCLTFWFRNVETVLCHG